MSPLEKAAKALYEFGMMADCPTWDQFDDRYKRDFFDMARAVLLAVRKAAEVHDWDDWNGEGAFPGNCLYEFGEVIDAILEGE